MKPDSANNTCANCGEATQQAFCGNCGQRVTIRRLDVSSVVSQALRAVLELDSPIWRTLRDFTINPGKAADNYVSGQRIRYINPLKYLFVSFAISYGLMLLTGTFDSMMLMMEEAQSTSVDADGTELSADAQAFNQAIRDLFRYHMDLITFVSTPLFALLFTMQNFRSDRNFAEILSFCCFLFAHTYLLGNIFTLVHYFTGYISNWPQVILLLGYFYYGSKVFFNRGWLRTISTVIFASAYYFLSMLAVLVLFSLLRVKGLF